MSVNKNHSEQFEKYLKGQMSPQEAHVFEREVLDDPFAQEALEGYEAQGLDAIRDIDPLKGQITATPKKTISFMRIAATVALLIIGSFTIYFFADRIESEQLAMEEEPLENVIQSAPGPDTIAIPEVDERNSEKEILGEGDSLFAVNENADELKKDEPILEIVEVSKENTEPIVRQEVIDEDTKDESEDKFYYAETGEVIIESDFEEVDDVSTSLQGAVAGVQVEKASNIDTNAFFESLDVIPPTLAAKEESKRVRFSETKSKKQASEVALARSAIANGVVTGQVTDDSGELIPGVNVVIKGTTQGAITDLDGNYKLPKSDDMTLIFSFVGFETQEVAVGSRSNVNVTMGGSVELQEVVVTDYGITDKDDGIFSPARPMDGKKSYKEYLENNLNYPDQAIANDIEGTVILEVFIGTTGEVQSIDIKKSLGYGCDEEAIRLVREGPGWESAKNGDSSVEDRLRIKVKFKID